MGAGGDGCEPTGSSRKASESGSARGSATSSRADSEERLALLDPIAARSLCLSLYCFYVILFYVYCFYVYCFYVIVST